jgi:NADH:ubiquinone oxidoreductase subunit K
MFIYEPIIWLNINDLFLLLPISDLRLFFLLYIGFFLIIIGFLGFIYQKRSILHLLLAIELILLGFYLIGIFILFFYNNVQAILLILMLMTLAAGESAIGFSLLISFYRIRSDITLEIFNRLHYIFVINMFF